MTLPHRKFKFKNVISKAQRIRGIFDMVLQIKQKIFYKTKPTFFPSQRPQGLLGLVDKEDTNFRSYSFSILTAERIVHNKIFQLSGHEEMVSFLP